MNVGEDILEGGCVQRDDLGVPECFAVSHGRRNLIEIDGAHVAVGLCYDQVGGERFEELNVNPVNAGMVRGEFANARVDDAARFVPLWDPTDPRDLAFVNALLSAWGGATFRLDRPTRIAVRALGLFLRNPFLAAFRLQAWAFRWLKRAGVPIVPLCVDLARGRRRLRYLNLVSHHFMGAAEVETETGRERLASCAFRVPVEGELVSMCAVNTLGARESVYAAARANP